MNERLRINIVSLILYCTVKLTIFTKKVQQELEKKLMKSNNKNSKWSFYFSRKFFISE